MTPSTANERRTPLAAVILAAGKGTRMKSSLPKVLHTVAGEPILGHILTVLKGLGAARQVVVVGPSQDDVAKFAAAQGAKIRRFIHWKLGK